MIFIILDQFWMGNPKMIVMQANFYDMNTNFFICTNIDPYGSMLDDFTNIDPYGSMLANWT